MDHRHLAELVGTFFLVFCGCAAIAAGDLYGAPSHEGIALVFGLVVMAMIYAIGNVSGAHLNPAVSLGFWAAGRLPPAQLPRYALAQLGGAILASLALRIVFPSHPTLGAALPHAGVAAALATEFVLSFLLMFVILNVATGHKEKGIMAGVAVGGTIALGALLGGALSGASMNPARSLGPALVSGQWSGHWIYWAGPVFGALAAVPCCRWVQGSDCCPS